METTLDHPFITEDELEIMSCEKRGKINLLLRVTTKETVFLYQYESPSEDNHANSVASIYYNVFSRRPHELLFETCLQN